MALNRPWKIVSPFLSLGVSLQNGVGARSTFFEDLEVTYEVNIISMAAYFSLFSFIGLQLITGRFILYFMKNYK